MNANKIILNNEILIDLTQDTAIEEDVAEGKTFHKADGSAGVGIAHVGPEDLDDVLTEQETLIVELKATLNDKISGGGGVISGDIEINIAYGDEPPTDTSKLWIKTSSPSNVVVSSESEYGENARIEETMQLLDVQMPASIIYAMSAAVGTKIYIFGGNSNAETGKQIYCFDTETQTLSTLATQLPYVVFGGTASAIGTKIYFVGGSSTNGRSGVSENYRPMRIFDTETEIITTTTYWYGTGGVGMYGVTGAPIGDSICLFGGQMTTDTCSWVTEFDSITCGYLPGASYMPKAFIFASAATVKDKVYLLGGNIASPPQATSLTPHNVIYSYDPATDTIETLTTKLPSSAYAMGCAVVEDKIYLLGGRGSNGSLYSIVCYDPQSDKIKTMDLQFVIDNVSKTAYAMTASAVGTDIYTFGGYIGGSASKYIFKYSPPLGNMLLENNTLQIYPHTTKNIVQLLNAAGINVNIGIDKIYKGSTNNEAEPVEAYLYKNDEWTLI